MVDVQLAGREANIQIRTNGNRDVHLEVVVARRIRRDGGLGTADVDAEQLAPVLSALGYPADAATVGDRLRALPAADPTGRVLVAIDDDSIVGFASLHCTPVVHRATSVGRITGLAIVPSAQGTGAGRALVDA